MAAVDSAKGTNSQDFPASSAAAVTPNDSADLGFVTRAVWVGGAGTLNVVMADGQTVPIVGILAGTLLPIRVARVLNTSTTATNIVALW